MTIGEAAIEILLETDNPCICWGDTVLLHMVANRANLNRENVHPMEVCRRVMAGLNRSPLFAKSLAHLKPGFRGNQTCRVFTPNRNS